MTHLTEEQLVLHYYGEANDPAAADTHLAECAECRSHYAGIQRTLNSMSGLAVPERSAGYSTAVWQKLERRIPIRRRARNAAWFPRWAFAGGLCALLAMAFLAGRWSVGPAPSEVAKSTTPQVREKVLLVALGDHLERSQRVLVELSNENALPVGGTRQRAQDLLEDNRLYRQAALRDQEPGLASVLDDLERLLADVSHASDEDWAEIRARMADQGILFKVRVIESNVRQREKEQLPMVRN